MASTLSASSDHRVKAALSQELNVAPRQIEAAVGLLDEGATVPFIARYRKEVTGNLDDTQLRLLAERLEYLRDMESRREAILASINEQGKLTEVLAAAIDAAQSKQALEDLYLPYKPKRRTRAQIAREQGLEPLADRLLGDPSLDPQAEALGFVCEAQGDVPAVADARAALDGARDILSERFAENAQVLARARELLSAEGRVRSTVVEGKAAAEEEKFRDYYDYEESLASVPSHRALALFRGRTLGILTIRLTLGEAREAEVPHPGERAIARLVGVDALGRPADKWLADVVRWTWRVKVQPALENELLTGLRDKAEAEAITVFGRNLHELLLAAPAGPKAVLGLDPGIRTGCKIAVVDKTGKLLETATIYPHEPRRDWQGSMAVLKVLIERHQVELIAIGNGTAGRETDKLAAEVIAALRGGSASSIPTKIMVSEAGASVYSASELAAREFPDLDVSLRGAVSIARRLQDPLAELVKIDPKAIGVGQYQHDLNQRELAKRLDAVVEDCVNAVGVDVNTASVALLSKVSGLNAVLAKNIVDYRDAKGGFKSRAQLREVPRLGDKTFEQAAGFLRIGEGDNPLDRSAVHPEAYPVVERILAKLKKGISEVMGRPEVIRPIDAAEFADERFGVPTVKDILVELQKPGRDPRPEFKTATFADGIESLKDLKEGMVLEGVVTNVAGFGAFVDIGVHQDGLVHVSALSERFVKDPHDAVRPGQIVKVRVLEVDLKRSRIALTMRLNDAPPKRAHSDAPSRNQDTNSRGSSARTAAPRQTASRGAQADSAMALAFAKLKR